MNFQERLKYLLNRDGVTAYRVWKDTTITKATIGNYLEGRTTPNKANVSLLASYFNVNDEWLFHGTGSQNRETQNKPLDLFDVSDFGVKTQTTKDKKYKIRVPLITVRDYGKYLDNHRNNAFLTKDNFDELDFILDHVDDGRYYAFELKGDSMDDNTRRSLANGDIVLCKELMKEEWKEILQSNTSSFWIIISGKNILCKEIVAYNEDNNTITCHSSNPSPEYANFELRLDSISHLYNIEQRLTTSFY